MGRHIEEWEFSEDDRRRFARRLEQCLEALEALVARPSFGEGPSSIGAELEIYLIDDRGQPALCNRAVLDALGDRRVTLELNRYNLEYNADPLPLAGRPFTSIAGQLDDALARLRSAARSAGARVLATGILPTLGPADLEPSVMSDQARYHALSRGLRELRGAPFRLRIEGVDEGIDTDVDDVTAEGAATSFQLHLRIDPARFAPIYNAAQAATAPALAVSGNSPVFLRRVLWEETRIALFKQATDYRPPGGRAHLPARVTFGDAWVGAGPVELFRYEVDHFAPLLPVLSGAAPSAALERGEAPELAELRLHHSTVWRWNRPVYDPADGGHLRIEFRALPAGPTSRDMAANAAFIAGLSLGLAPTIDELIGRLPFAEAHNNFYRAAQSGLAATLAWPGPGGELRRVDATSLVLELIPTARAGLLAAGVDATETDDLLAVIAARARSGRTGSRWQRAWLAEHEAGASREAALGAVLERYLTHSLEGEPVHCWPLPDRRGQ